MIKIEEDKQFLLAQREEGRQGCMTGDDMSLTKMEKKGRHLNRNISAHA